MQRTYLEYYISQQMQCYMFPQQQQQNSTNKLVCHTFGEVSQSYLFVNDTQSGEMAHKNKYCRQDPNKLFIWLLK